MTSIVKNKTVYKTPVRKRTSIGRGRRVINKSARRIAGKPYRGQGR